MINRITLYSIKTFCFFTFIFYTIILDAQNIDTTHNSTFDKKVILISNSEFYKQSISININDLLIRRILINYSKLIKHQTYMDFTLAYRYCGPVTYNDNNDLDISITDNSSILYNQFTFRAGIKKYFFERIYLGLMANYNYDYNDDFKVFSDNFSSPNPRYRYEIGALIKFGLVLFKSNHFLSESYLGFGKLESYRKEISNVPEYSHLITSTFHFGLTIGLKK